MIFRPRIFISSTFSENVTLRNEIKDLLVSLGAEPLLYERNLTPSTIPLAYRENIKDADFVILIVKKNYGTPTKSGLSGTHEEYKLAALNKIPTHVYFQRNESADSTEPNPLTDDIKSDNISFYYFSNDEELIARLKETVFTIAREIMISQIDKSILPKEAIFRLSCKHDYSIAIEVIKIIEGMHELHDVNNLDYLDNALFLVCIEPIISEFKGKKNIFVNWKLEDALLELVNFAETILEIYSIDYTSQGNTRSYSMPVLKEVLIGRSTRSESSKHTPNDYINLINDFHEKYSSFLNLVNKVRLWADLIDS